MDKNQDRIYWQSRAKVINIVTDLCEKPEDFKFIIKGILSVIKTNYKIEFVTCHCESCKQTFQVDRQFDEVVTCPYCGEYHSR